MGGISYPRTVGRTEQARLVSNIEDKIEALLNSVDPSASALVSIMALVDRVNFEKLSKALQVKLFALLRGKLQVRIATVQFNLSKANNTFVRESVQQINNAMIRLALSFKVTDKSLPLHECLNQMGAFDFKLLLDAEDLTIYSMSDGMLLIENQDINSPEFANAAQICLLSVKAINQAKPEIQKKLVEGWEANKIVSISAGFLAKNKTLALETKDGGHSIARHGPDVSNGALKRRLETGIAPDGKFSPTPASTRFKSNEEWLKTRVDAIKAIEEKHDVDLRKPPKSGEDTKYPINLDHGRAIDDGFVGDHSTAVRIQEPISGKRSRVFPDSNPVSGITRTQTIVQWNPDSNTWEVKQHYPDAKDWNQSTQSYDE